MGKKLITERYVSQQFQEGKKEIFFVGPNELIAPLAKDFAASKQMKIIYGKAEECPLIVKKEQESPADLDSEIRAIIRKDFNITDEKRTGRSG